MTTGIEIKFLLTIENTFSKQLGRGKFQQNCEHVPLTASFDFIGINAVKCVRFNFRKCVKNFRDFKSKKRLLNYLKFKRCKVTIAGELVPKESYLIKTGMRNGKLGCDCILELTKQRDLRLLQKLVERFEKRRKDGKEAFN